MKLNKYGKERLTCSELYTISFKPRTHSERAKRNF